MPEVELQKREHVSVSSLRLFQKCPKAYFHRYMAGLRRDRPTAPQRKGLAGHEALDRLATGMEYGKVLDGVLEHYRDLGEDAEAFTMLRLLEGYFLHWRDCGMKVEASELEIVMPIYNPETGAHSTRWSKKLVIDKVVRLADGRLALVDHKFVSRDIRPGSDYREKLRLDMQISLYMLAAREKGWDVGTFVYDLVKWPTTVPAELTIAQMKEVADSGTYLEERATTGERQEAKQTLKTREDAKASRKDAKKLDPSAEGPDIPRPMRESPRMHATRVASEIREAPDRFFQRVEVVRTDRDLDEFAGELWAWQKMVAAAENCGKFPRNTDACLHPFKCDYFAICTAGISDFTTLPEGYVRDDGTGN